MFTSKKYFVPATLALLLVATIFFFWQQGALAQDETQQNEPARPQQALAASLGTAISYQGSLAQSGSPANGSFNFDLSLFDAVTGGTQIGTTQTFTGVTVTDGVFSIPALDFGAGAFNGEARFLAITVNGTALSPRQELKPVPYALALPGLYTQQTNSSPNIIGGDLNNVVISNAVGATMSGGGSNQITHAYLNLAYATVGGGSGNIAGHHYATVAGGRNNQVIGSGSNAAIVGGESNEASEEYAFVGGGYNNTASNISATIVGGEDNTASGEKSTIGGGRLNSANGTYATIPGGTGNSAAGYSLAAGYYANAQHTGSFVWSDASSTAGPATTANNQFVVRASGGTYFYSNSAKTTGVSLSAGGGSWSSLSDRNAKANVEMVNGRFILDQLANIPISTWNYISQDESIRHIGPMAQDFQAAFAVGEEETRISTIDADGVALAAIQGLHEIVLEQEQEIEALEARIERLEAAIEHADPAKQSSAQPNMFNWLLLGSVGTFGLVAEWRRRQGGQA